MVNINSLVRNISGQEKVIDKDKALLELANAIENGGGGDSFVNEIKSVYTGTGPENLQKQTIEKIQYNGGEFDGFYIDIINNNNNFFIYLSVKDNIEEQTDVNTIINIVSNNNELFSSYKILDISKTKLMNDDIYIICDENLDPFFVVKIRCRQNV